MLLQAGPCVLPARDAVGGMNLPAEHPPENCPVTLLWELLGFLGLKSLSKPNPTHQICVLHPCTRQNLTLEKSLHSPRERKQRLPQWPAPKSHQAFPVLSFGNSIQLSEGTGWPSWLRHCSQIKQSSLALRNSFFFFFGGGGPIVVSNT